MSIIETWLAPYRSYLSAEALRAALLSEPAQDSEDPEAFFRDLLAPVGELSFETSYWTHIYTEQEAPDELSASPEAARDFLLRKLQGEDQATPWDAAALAQAYFKLGSADKSEVCTAVAYLAGDRTQITLSLLAGMAIREQRYDEAQVVVDEARTAHGPLGEVAFCQTALQVARGDYAAARAGLEALVVEHPAYVPPWKLLLDVLGAQGQWQEATRQATAATKLHPLEPELWERLAIAWRGAGNPERAVQAMQKALDAAGRSVGLARAFLLRLHLGMALLLEEAGQPEQALAVYQTQLRSGHTEPAIFLNAASCLKHAGQTSSSVELLREGLRRHPEQPDLLTNLGEILFESHQDQEAFELLQQAASQEPQRFGNLVLMAGLCLRNQQFDQAIELASAVAKADPSRAAAALLILGDAHRHQGSLEAALEVYRGALQHSPEEEVIRLRVEETEKKLENS